MQQKFASTFTQKLQLKSINFEIKQKGYLQNTYLQLPCIKIQDIMTLCSILKGLNFNLKLTKLSRNPGKNKIYKRQLLK